MLLPTLSRAKQKAYGIQCANNQRQLIFAATIYGDDANDIWFPNQPQDTDPKQLGWVTLPMDFSPLNTDNTNINKLLDPNFAKLAPYTKAAGIYKCPADKSTVVILGPRVRSVVANQAVGSLWLAPTGCARRPNDPVTGQWLTGSFDNCQTAWRTYGKSSQMTVPGAANLWVFVDEHPNTINDATLAVECQNAGTSGKLIDVPASFHGGGAGFSFADGHAEIHGWKGSAFKPAFVNGVTGVPSRAIVTAQDVTDLDWLQTRTSAPNQ